MPAAASGEPFFNSVTLSQPNLSVDSNFARHEPARDGSSARGAWSNAPTLTRPIRMTSNSSVERHRRALFGRISDVVDTAYILRGNGSSARSLIRIDRCCELNGINKVRFRPHIENVSHVLDRHLKTAKTRHLHAGDPYLAPLAAMQQHGTPPWRTVAGTLALPVWVSLMGSQRSLGLIRRPDSQHR